MSEPIWGPEHGQGVPSNYCPKCGGCLIYTVGTTSSRTDLELMVCGNRETCTYFQVLNAPDAPKPAPSASLHLGGKEGEKLRDLGKVEKPDFAPYWTARLNKQEIALQRNRIASNLFQRICFHASEDPVHMMRVIAEDPTLSVLIQIAQIVAQRNLCNCVHGFKERAYIPSSEVGADREEGYQPDPRELKFSYGHKSSCLVGNALSVFETPKDETRYQDLLTTINAEREAAGEPPLNKPEIEFGCDEPMCESRLEPGQVAHPREPNQCPDCKSHRTYKKYGHTRKCVDCYAWFGPQSGVVFNPGRAKP